MKGGHTSEAEVVIGADPITGEVFAPMDKNKEILQKFAELALITVVIQLLLLTQLEKVLLLHL